MTLNFQKYGKEIQESFNKVVKSKTGDEWSIFDYEGTSNIIKIGEEGDGGIDEFVNNFNNFRLQYGVISIRLSPNVLPKIVLVHWQGEQVPSSRVAATTAHAQEMRNFLKMVHILHNARSEIDIEPDVLRREVAKLPGTVAVNQVEVSYSAPTSVGSVYTPVKPHMDSSLKEREKFWQEINREEKTRKCEEKQHSTVQQLVKPENVIKSPENDFSSSNIPVKSEQVVLPSPIESAKTTQIRKGLCAVSLWDYQSSDQSEISFDPDEIITEIQQIDEGWWKGRSPSGQFGLFPANYVRLI